MTVPETPSTPQSAPRPAGFLECTTDASGHVAFPELCCAAGHRIPWEFAFHEAGYPRCAHANTSGHRVCPERLFVQFFPRMNKAANPMLFVARITYPEIQHVTKHTMDVPAILSYLGLTWNPPRNAR